MAALKYWIWLAEKRGVRRQTKLALTQRFETPEELYYAETDEVLLTEGITREEAAALEDKDLRRAEEILEVCERQDYRILTIADAAYPRRLRNIFDPPILLYCRGRLPLMDEEAAIAVVGTRSYTPYGALCAGKLGGQLAAGGAVIVTGLAYGIDSLAARAALRNGGRVLGVLGCGLDVVYPRGSEELYEDVAAAGALITEYAPGTLPLSGNFPVRNRILSGLSVAVLVVEAPERSGALITAGTALEQGREVFAVPGPIDAAASVGCNRLIRDGAGLAASGWDILSVYHSRFPHRLHPAQMTVPEPGETPRQEESPPPAQKPEPEAPAAPELPVLDLDRNREGLTDDQLALIRVLDTETPLLTDEAAEQTGLPVRRVLSALTVLEIDGYAQRSGPRSYVRTVRLHSEKEGS